MSEDTKRIIELVKEVMPSYIVLNDSFQNYYDGFYVTIDAPKFSQRETKWKPLELWLMDELERMGWNYWIQKTSHDHYIIIETDESDDTNIPLKTGEESGETRTEALLMAYKWAKGQEEK